MHDCNITVKPLLFGSGVNIFSFLICINVSKGINDKMARLFILYYHFQPQLT
jgi:hypothetical protein